MKWTLAFILLASFSVKAEVAPDQVESMLAQMVRENVISQTEADKARMRMKSMTPDQWSQINQKAAVVAARSPASYTPSQNKIEEVNNIDLDGAQFKAIQNEVKKIMPEFRELK